MFRLGLRQASLALTITTIAALAASGTAKAAEAVTGLTPLAAQPATVNPGLAVMYHFSIFNFTYEVGDWARYKDGTPGEPIPQLDYMVGSGDVLTSDHHDGVGAQIEGLINFPEAGTYTMAVHSNDGVELEIGGQPIVSDPDVHADRFSELVPVVIDTPGWYPLKIVYFEKRNTSTLELYWLRPGETGSLDFVPAENFGHLPGTQPGA